MSDTTNIFEQTGAKSIEGLRGDQEKRNQDYILDYETFMKEFQLKEISGEEVGLMVSRMANHFIRHNLILVRSLKIYSKIRSEIQGQTDATTGKAMSTSKAEIMAAATPEANAYEEARAHVNNIQECINALKALQRGVLQEYSNSV